MNEKNLKSWKEFEEEIDRLDAELEEKKRGTSLRISDLLFRGHSNSAFHLETTLERFLDSDISLLDYYEIILAAKHKIETFTGAPWDIPDMDDYKMWLENKFDEFFGKFEAYGYFAYLRHHGFPSPLLDWTASPYIAAFFAFNDIDKSTDYVSVFAFCEYYSGGKTATGGEPIIRSLGPHIRAHKRHFFQQSRYTICTERRSNNIYDIYYAKHEDIASRNEKDQDKIWKFNIPKSERKCALSKLHRMNINAFSLFGTEESLLESIATNDIFLRLPAL